MTDNFQHARANAQPDCPRCGGTGSYQYTTRGTPNFTVCDMCCKHDRGWWKLEKHYGENNNKWCCRAGCGKTVDTPPHEQPENIRTNQQSTLGGK